MKILIESGKFNNFHMHAQLLFLSNDDLNIFEYDFVFWVQPEFVVFSHKQIKSLKKLIIWF